MSLAPITVSAGAITLTLVPALGAKVVSLRYRDGPEWLAAPVRPLREPPSPAGDWADYDCSGWDECFPNVGAAPAAGLGDHGEVWSTPWRVTRLTASTVTTAVTMADRYTLTRTLCLHDDGGVGTVTADYRVDVLGDRPLSWAWSQHPLLAAEDAMQLVVSGPASVRVDSAFAAGRAARRPDWLDGYELSTVTPMHPLTGRAAKLWFGSPGPDVVAAVRPEDWLAWRLDRSSNRHLGLWVNRDGWGPVPLHHVAVEPSFGDDDDFGRATARGAGPVLSGGSSHGWRVVLQLGGRRTEVPGHPMLIPN